VETTVDPTASAAPKGNLGVVLKSMAWFVFHRGFVILLGFISAGWVARQLGPENNGILASSRALVALFAVFASGMDGNVLTKRLIEHRERNGEIIGGSTAVLVGLGIVSWTALMIFVWALSGTSLTAKWTTTICSLPMLITFQAPVGYWFQSKLMVRNMVLPMTASTLTLRLWQIACVAVGASVFAVAASDLAAVIVAVAMVMFFYLRSGQHFRSWRLDWKEGFSVLMASLPALIAGSVLVLLNRMSILSLRASQGEAAAGFFGAASSLTESLVFLQTMVATTLLPLLVSARKLDYPRYLLHRTAFARMCAFLGWGCALGLSLGSALAVKVVFGPNYAPSAGVLSIYALVLVPIFLGQCIQTFFTLENLLPWLVVFRVCGLIANVLLNMLLIPRWGGEGAAWATVIGSLVAHIIAPLFCRKTREIARVLAGALLWPAPNIRHLPLN